jgi:hypothetical protein
MMREKVESGDDETRSGRWDAGKEPKEESNAGSGAEGKEVKQNESAPAFQGR